MLRTDTSIKLKYVHCTALILTTVIFLYACSDKKPNNGSHYGGTVAARVAQPQERLITAWKEFTGRFQAVKRVEIRTRVSGYLKEIRFTDGQIVKKNDILFVIDQRPFKIALESAQARFELANKEYKRAKKLRSLKAISEEDYDKRLQEQRIVTADLAKAKLDLAYTQVKAPFTGRISRKLQHVGSLISGSNYDATLLTTLVSISPIEFYFEISESDLLEYLRISKESTSTKKSITEHTVLVKLQDEDSFVHRGKINFLDNELARDTNTIQLRAIFNNKDSLLKPGLFARLRTAWSEAAKMLVIPPHIVGTEQTRKYVYVVDKEGKAIRKYVQLGGLTKDGLRIVKQGLALTDTMIIGNLHMIQAGSSVKVLEVERPSPAPRHK